MDSKSEQRQEMKAELKFLTFKDAYIGIVAVIAQKWAMSQNMDENNTHFSKLYFVNPSSLTQYRQGCDDHALHVKNYWCRYILM